MPHSHTALQGQDCAGPFTAQQRMEKVSSCCRRTDVIILFRSISCIACATEMDIEGDNPSLVLGCPQLDIAHWPDTCMQPPGTHCQQGNLIGTHCLTLFTCSQFVLTALGLNWSDQLRGMAESKQYNLESTDRRASQNVTQKEKNKK